MSYKVGDVLTSNDPEPPIGVTVRDGCYKFQWSREDGFAGWYPFDSEPDYGESESWCKIAGNYGPVTVTAVDDDSEREKSNHG